MHAFALGFFAVCALLFFSITTRGVIRTVVDVFKFAFVGVAVLGVVALVAVVLLQLLAVEGPAVQEAGTPGTNWLDSK